MGLAGHSNGTPGGSGSTSTPAKRGFLDNGADNELGPQDVKEDTPEPDEVSNMSVQDIDTCSTLLPFVQT